MPANFSNAIQNQTAHPNVFLAFGSFEDKSLSEHVAISEPQFTPNESGDIICAGFIYEVDQIAVKVIYAKFPDNHPELKKFIHPSANDTTIYFSNFDSK